MSINHVHAVDQCGTLGQHASSATSGFIRRVPAMILWYPFACGEGGLATHGGGAGAAAAAGHVQAGGAQRAGGPAALGHRGEVAHQVGRTQEVPDLPPGRGDLIVAAPAVRADDARVAGARQLPGAAAAPARA